MISCILQGRTGNQLFQLANAYAYAKRNGFDFVAPPTSANERLWPSHRFKLPYGNMKGEIYNEPHFHYKEIPVQDGLVMNGYFQSAKYFEDYSAELLEIFGFEETVQPGTCAIHVRRGDYIEFNSQFNLLPHTWYENAMKEMGPDVEFHFYSDDIEYCKNVFPNHIYHHAHPMLDLKMAAQHEHCIMSASSFSWWIGYNVSGTVIAPKTWFGPANAKHYTRDLYLDHWIKM